MLTLKAKGFITFGFHFFNESMKLKSIWRTSHLLLATISSLFLLIAAVTGGFLAFEPILHQTKSYHITNSDAVTVSEFIIKLKKQNKPFSSFKYNSGHLLVNFDDGKFYVNTEGERLHKREKQHKFFKFLTKLHRSLFLKSTGRAIIGIMAFLLFLITLTGILLMLKKQKGIKTLFNHLVKDNSHQYYHTYLGRLLVIPIVVLAVTGTYLSMKRFKFVDTNKIRLKVSEVIVPSVVKPISDFKIFKNFTISDVKELKLPFSDDKDEFYHLKLNDREFLINQFSGEVVAREKYPFIKKISSLSFDLHTGFFNFLWAIVLMVSSFSILYFMYSGFVIAYIRFRVRLRNKFHAKEAELVILFGSENGSTKSYAKMLYEGFLKADQKVYIASLNKYQEFIKMKQLIVLTATYGDGVAPSNATKFLNLLNNKKIKHPFQFSVVGFGSRSYPKFCAFAKEVDIAFGNEEKASRIIALQTVNNRSFEQFATWMRLWSKETGIDAYLDKKMVSKRKKTIDFEVINRVEKPNQNSFLIELLPKKNSNFQSGDLLGIYPNHNTHERLYSIAKIDNKILLSVKLHFLGVCSNFLKNSQSGDFVSGFIQKNKDFHFPKKASKVIMIATGTGIAPFLGMLTNNHKKITTELYFGLKNKAALSLYEDSLQEKILQGKLSKIYYAFSRETHTKIYVQDLILKDVTKLLYTLHTNGVIMICGSIAMQTAVFEVLNKELKDTAYKSVSYFKKRNQILVDCY